MKSLKQYISEALRPTTNEALSEALVKHRVKIHKPKTVNSLDDLEPGDYFHIDNPASRRFALKKPKGTGYACIFMDRVSDEEYKYSVSIGDINSPFLEKPIVIRKAIHNVNQSTPETVSDIEDELLSIVKNNIDINKLYKEIDGMIIIVGYINAKTFDIKIKDEFKKYIKDDAQNIVTEALVNHRVKIHKKPDVSDLKPATYLFCQGNEIKYIYVADKEYEKPFIIICHENPIDADDEYDDLGISDDNANLYDILEQLSILEKTIKQFNISKYINKADKDGKCDFGGMYMEKFYTKIDNVMFELNIAKTDPDFDKIKDIVYVESLEYCEDFDSVYLLNCDYGELEKIREV